MSYFSKMMGSLSLWGKPWSQQYNFNPAQTTDITDWAAGTAYPTPARLSSVGIVTASRVYLLGGEDNVGFRAEVSTAPINSDGTLGTWAAGTALPVTLAYSQGIVTKNRVYLLGGYAAGADSQVVYTATIDSAGVLGTWANANNNLPALLRNSQAVVTTNRVYLLGGYEAGLGNVSKVYTAPIGANGIIGAWANANNNLPIAIRNSQAITTKNRVYLMGGFTSAYVKTVYTAPIDADGIIGAWSAGTDLPAVRAVVGIAVTENRVYLIGGYNGAIMETVVTAPINANGTLGAWASGTSLPFARHSTSVIVTSSKINIFGYDDVANTPKTEIASFSGGRNTYQQN